METEILLNEIKVMYVKSESGPQGAGYAFTGLESKLPSIKGRKFYGLILDDGKTYLSSVAIADGDDPKALDCAVTSIPAGKYVKTKIWEWMDRLDEIYPTFRSLSKKYKEDKCRPRIEFYRSQKELILLFPIL